MRTRLGMVAGVVLVAAAAGISLLPAVAPPAQPPADIGTGQSLVCPTGPGPTRMVAMGDDVISTNAPDALPTVAGKLVSLANQSTPIVMRSATRFTAGSYVTTGATLGWSRCLTPRTSGVVQFAMPKASDLLLVNADGAEAVVDLTLFGAKGEVPAVGSSGIALAPRSSRIVPISALVADNTPIGVRVQTTTGRVSVVGRTWATVSGDFSNVGVPGLVHVLPGLPAASTSVKVLVTNPGKERASVSVSALGSQTVAVAGAQNQLLDPGRTIELDVSEAVRGEAVALRVTADRPVVASAVASGGADHAFVSASEPLLSGRVVVPGQARLSLTNPSEVRVTVAVATASATPSKVSIEPGKTWLAPEPAAKAGGTTTWSVVSAAPIVGAVTVAGTAGWFVAPVESLSVPGGVDIALGYDTNQR